MIGGVFLLVLLILGGAVFVGLIALGVRIGIRPLRRQR
jgi:hypothetical protein